MKINKIVKSFEYESQTRLKNNQNFPFDLYFQYILLHEFIHAFLDIASRNIYGELITSNTGCRADNKGKDNSYTEESLDKFTCLKVYEQSNSSNSAIIHIVAKIIQYSPKEYNLGFELYDSKRDKLAEEMLEKLLLHKLK